MANLKGVSKIRNLIAYLKNVWGKNLNLQDPELLDINGMRAATGRARVFISGQSRELRLVVIQEESDRIYRLIFMAAPSDMQNLTGQFISTLGYSSRPGTTLDSWRAAAAL